MKKIVVFISALLMMSLFSISAFAENAPITENCKSFSYFFDENEFLQVIDQAIADPFTKETDQIGKTSADSTEYKGYKEFMVSHKLLTDLENGKQLNELLPTEYRWVIHNDKGDEAVAAKKTDGWKAIGYSRVVCELLESSGVADARVDVDMVNSALNIITDDIIGVVCVYIPAYYGKFICITTSTKPYLISFNARPEFTGLENGRLYDLSEANDILYQNFGDMSTNADIVKDRSVDELGWEDIIHFKYGGAGKTVQQDVIQEYQSAEIPFLPIILIPAIVISVIITVMLLIWNNGSRKHTK